MIKKDNINLTKLTCCAAITLLFALDFPFSHAAERSLTPTRKEISVRQLSPIEFGTVAGSREGGTVTIAAATGMRTVSSSLAAIGGQYGQAEFEISGQPGEEVTVAIPDSIVLDGKDTQGGLTITRL